MNAIKIKDLLLTAQGELSKELGVPVVIKLGISKPDRLRLIIKSVAEASGIDIAIIESKERKQSIAEARQVIYYIATTHFAFTYSEVSRYFHQNHTTALAAVRRVRDLLSINDRSITDIINRSLTQLLYFLS